MMLDTCSLVPRLHSRGEGLHGDIQLIPQAS